MKNKRKRKIYTYTQIQDQICKKYICINVCVRACVYILFIVNILK